MWILVASTLVEPQNPQGWVMFVSVFCFVMTFIWMVVFTCGGHHNKSSWATAVGPTKSLLHLQLLFIFIISPADGAEEETPAGLS